MLLPINFIIYIYTHVWRAIGIVLTCFDTPDLHMPKEHNHSLHGSGWRSTNSYIFQVKEGYLVLIHTLRWIFNLEMYSIPSKHGIFKIFPWTSVFLELLHLFFLKLYEYMQQCIAEIMHAYVFLITKFEDLSGRDTSQMIISLVCQQNNANFTYQPSRKFPDGSEKELILWKTKLRVWYLKKIQP